jgi:hypothetical protein
MRSVCAIFLCAISLAGCSSKETPTSPTPPVVSSPLPPADKIVSIFVSGGQWVVVGGAPLQLSARIFTKTEAPAEFVDDTSHVTWSADPAGVVAVDSKGSVTGIGSGSVRVTATVGDKSGSLVMRAVPDYTGTWSGNYIVTACSGAADPRTCGRLMLGQGTAFTPVPYPFSLTVSQLQDQVTGTLHEQGDPFKQDTPVRGFVRVSGELVLEGFVPLPEHLNFTITNWSSTFNQKDGKASGAFTRIAPTFTTFTTYTLRTEHEFSGVTRTP